MPLNEKIDPPNANRRAEYDRRYNQMRKLKLQLAVEQATKYKDRIDHLETQLRDRDQLILAHERAMAQMAMQLQALGATPITTPVPPAATPAATMAARKADLSLQMPATAAAPTFTTLDALAQMSVTLPHLPSSPPTPPAALPLSPASTSCSLSPRSSPRHWEVVRDPVERQQLHHHQQYQQLPLQPFQPQQHQQHARFSIDFIVNNS